VVPHLLSFLNVKLPELEIERHSSVQRGTPPRDFEVDNVPVWRVLPSRSTVMEETVCWLHGVRWERAWMDGERTIKK